MKKLIGMVLLWAFALSLHAEGGNWLTDFSDAKKKAKEENKKVVMLFTGSDWCSWCMKWDKEVFSKSEFQDYANKNLVLLLVDFPQKKKMSKAQERANDALQSKYKIEGYPTVVVLDSQAKKVGSFGYSEGGPAAFFSKLESLK
jgi:thioredoxin-related protein